jgi:hypothetical protein
VGIGTQTPLEKLHIVGGIRSDSLRIDGVNGSSLLAQINGYTAGLDQQQTLEDAYYGLNVPGWQSFTAGFSGNLDSVAFNWPDIFVTELTISIYRGEGTGGTVLFSKPVTTRSNFLGSSYTIVPVTGVSVVAGQVYTIGLSTIRLWRCLASGNPYPAGNSSLGAGIDFTFKTYGSGPSPGFVIKNAGMVGIGTSNPSSRLDVAGNLTVSGNITLNGTLNYSGSFVNESPINLPMLNGWVNYGPGFTNASYFKDKNGIVRLEGLIKSGTTNVIANLPAGYRPGAALLFIAVNGFGAFARIDVGPDGNITVVAPYTNGYLSLSGISFRAVQ